MGSVIPRRRMLAGIGLAGLAVSSLGARRAWAGPYPDRPITMIRPFSAGGGADATWRIITAATSAAIGQSIVVEPRPGAAGRNGLNALKNAAPDGYVIVGGTNIELVIQGLAEPKFIAEPGKDYTPITTTFLNSLVLIANPKVKFRDFHGMVAYAKAHPGELNFASGGVGSTSHLGLEMINLMAGTKIVHVPYKGGAPAQAAVVSGEVDLGLASGAAKEFVAGGQLIAIATTSAERWDIFPQTPTLSELGLPVTVAPWEAVIGPPGLPPDIVSTLVTAFHKALAEPSLMKKLHDAGNVIIPSTPAEFVARIQSERKIWGPVVQQVGLKFD